ncbi:hypothetical protein HDZ31DRAFT_71076 [Schizophyllum fasciatum]
MPVTRAALLSAAEQFCTAFASNTPPDELIAYFSTLYQPTALEHGEPALAPFIGRPFVGLPAVLRYFELLASLLTYENMDFSSFVVDPEVRRVACRGRAVFKWRSTGESWDETFAYLIDFDEGLKVTDYQVWADSGAAYLASQGKLDEVREKAPKEKVGQKGS